MVRTVDSLQEAGAGASGGLLGPVANLGTRASDVLRNLIVQGKFQQGERINEVEMAAALGISRGPLREAIQNLASEGLIQLIPHRGAFIPTVTPEGLRQLYEVRRAIESEASTLAAETASGQDLDSLRHLLDETNSVLSSWPDSPYPLDLDFHRQLLVVARNPYLLKCGNELQLQVKLARVRSGSAPERARRAYGEHVEIMTRIADGDGPGAATAMRHHLEHSLDHALEVLSA